MSFFLIFNHTSRGSLLLEGILSRVELPASNLVQDQLALDLGERVARPGVVLDVVAEDERLLHAGEGSVGLDDDELVDDVLELLEPDLQDVQLV